MASALEWVKSNRYWLIACAVLAAAGYGAGRYAAPTKVYTAFEVKHEVVEREAKVVQKGPVVARKHTVVEVLPGGGRRTTSDLTLERGPVLTLTNTERRDTEVKTETKIVYRDAPRLVVGATAGWSGVPMYGGFATVRVLGPLHLFGQAEVGAGRNWGARGGVGIGF